MDNVKQSLQDIIRKISSSIKKDITYNELLERKVYLENLDTSKDITINNTNISCSNAEKKGVLVKDNRGYYIDLTPYINNNIEIVYYSS